MLKIITIVGTRPELIRLSRLIPLLDSYFEHKLVHTGQNYDYELNEVFFKDLNIRKPDYFLNVNTNSLGNVLGDTIIKSEEIFLKEKPDAVLILGDTNSSMAVIIAKRLKIPVYHMEAGNRSFDQNVPEEINRRIVDHTADFNLVYTEHARRNLIAEGIHPRTVYLTGSPMNEVLEHYSNEIESSLILKKLKLDSKSYFIVSLHREENVDKPSNLKELISVLKSVRTEFKKPIIVSTHPRTRKKLDELGLGKEKGIQFLKPFGFFDYIKLQKESYCVISDSGTISEESSILSFPAITLRKSMERPEAMDTGSIIITGFDKEVIINSIKIATSFPPTKDIPEEYKVMNCSERVLKLISGTTKLSNYWSNISLND